MLIWIPRNAATFASIGASLLMIAVSCSWPPATLTDISADSTICYLKAVNERFDNSSPMSLPGELNQWYHRLLTCFPLILTVSSFSIPTPGAHNFDSGMQWQFSVQEAAAV